MKQLVATSLSSNLEMVLRRRFIVVSFDHVNGASEHEVEAVLLAFLCDMFLALPVDSREERHNVASTLGRFWSFLSCGGHNLKW